MTPLLSLAPNAPATVRPTATVGRMSRKEGKPGTNLKSQLIGLTYLKEYSVEKAKSYTTRSLAPLRDIKTFDWQWTLARECFPAQNLSGLARLVRILANQRSQAIGSRFGLKSEMVGNLPKHFNSSFVFISLKMRLLTHNMLKSHVKGVKTGYPLAIEVSSSFICSCF